jgi:hypothetical protein
MASHVSEERLLDVMEGTAAGDRAHVEACPQCRARLAEAQDGLVLATSVQVPEPSPLYWDSLRRQVSRRLDEEGTRQPVWHRFAGPALAAAAVLLAVATFLPVARRQPAPAASAPERPLPAWSALPPADEDEGLDVLRAVAPAVADATPAPGCPGVADCVAALSDEESQVLAEQLRQEIGQGKSL